MYECHTKAGARFLPHFDTSQVAPSWGELTHLTEVTQLEKECVTVKPSSIFFQIPPGPDSRLWEERDSCLWGHSTLLGTQAFNKYFLECVLAPAPTTGCDLPGGKGVTFSGPGAPHSPQAPLPGTDQCHQTRKPKALAYIGSLQGLGGALATCSLGRVLLWNLQKYLCVILFLTESTKIVEAST